MDKQLLKAYIRTIVEEEVKRILPELLTEAVQQVKSLTENTTAPAAPAQTFDRTRLRELLNIDYDGDTLRATTDNLGTSNIPTNAPPEIVKALTRDYSTLMKKMGIT
jgi:hypothetical protein